MTILDYLLFAGFGTAVLYTGYRLFVGWLRSRSPETADQSRAIESSIKPKPAETGFITSAPWQSRDAVNQIVNPATCLHRRPRVCGTEGRCRA